MDYIITFRLFCGVFLDFKSCYLVALRTYNKLTCFSVAFPATISANHLLNCFFHYYMPVYITGYATYKLFRRECLTGIEPADLWLYASSRQLPLDYTQSPFAYPNSATSRDQLVFPSLLSSKQPIGLDIFILALASGEVFTETTRASKTDAINVSDID